MRKCLEKDKNVQTFVSTLKLICMAQKREIVIL